MKVFTYSLFHKIMYRYGNIPVTILLIIYLIPAVVDLDRNLLYFIPVVLLLGIIYLLNKHYLDLYKILPYKIETDNEKMICKDFLFSKKEFIIYYRDIDSLTGGIFDGRLAGLMKVCDKNNNVCVGFFNQLKNASDLETILLSKAPLEVYNQVVEKVGLKKKKNDKKK